MRRSLTIALGGPALLFALAACQPATPSAVASAAQPGAVPSFAQAVCGDCHALEPLQLSPNPEAPTFVSIANRPGLTSETLAVWLRDSHNYPEAMEFDLDEQHVSELTAYLLTLRDANYRRSSF